MKKVLSRFHTGLLSLPVALLLVTCSEIIDSDQYKIDAIKGEPSLALPLAFGELGISDFLNDTDSTFLKVDSDGLLYLSYEKLLKSQDIAELFNFPDRPFSAEVPLPPATIGASNTEATYGTPLDQELNMAYSPEKLTEMTLQQGSIEVTTSILPAQPANFNYEVLVELPAAKLNGASLSTRVTGNASIPLAGYNITFDENKMPLKLTIIKKPHANPIIIPVGTKVHIDLLFNGMNFSYIAGDFGSNRQVDLPEETLEIEAFENSFNNIQVSFATPKASFELINEYGIPVKVEFALLEARKNNDASSLPITLTDPSMLIAAPPQPGLTITTTNNVTNGNALLQFEPNKFLYKITAHINPPENASTENFCFNTSELKVKLKTDIPLHGTASDIVMLDTMDVDLGDLEESEVEEAFIRAKISNELPLDATLQIYLANEEALLLDSLFTTDQTKIVKGSTVTSTGDLSAAGVFDEEISIPKAKIDKLFNAKKLILKSKMGTVKATNGSLLDVKIKSSYKMNVNLGLRVNLKVNVDLNN